MERPAIIWTKDNIRTARERLNKKQQELANELGTTQSRISSWERGVVPKSAWQRLLTDYFTKNGVLPNA